MDIATAHYPREIGETRGYTRPVSMPMGPLLVGGHYDCYTLAMIGTLYVSGDRY